MTRWLRWNNREVKLTVVLLPPLSVSGTSLKWALRRSRVIYRQRVTLAANARLCRCGSRTRDNSHYPPSLRCMMGKRLDAAREWFMVVPEKWFCTRAHNHLSGGAHGVVTNHDDGADGCLMSYHQALQNHSASDALALYSVASPTQP